MLISHQPHEALRTHNRTGVLEYLPRRPHADLYSDGLAQVLLKSTMKGSLLRKDKIVQSRPKSHDIEGIIKEFLNAAARKRQKDR